ncbi:Integrase, catalytic core [Gossypium australe]|uniref:Integrase, catalytic core n=1 Tax=Gossypium australe TaxID=47621 RepID=A0A5B6VT84_9ROSI|nr:Integrase, catalytic core [Gossypium australe]
MANNPNVNHLADNYLVNSLANYANCLVDNSSARMLTDSSYLTSLADCPSENKLKCTSIRLLENQFNDSRVVEKVITTLSKRYESNISSFEDLKDLSTISLPELINMLYAQEHRRASIQDEPTEGAFQARGKKGLSFTNYKEKKVLTEKR